MTQITLEHDTTYMYMEWRDKLELLWESGRINTQNNTTALKPETGSALEAGELLKEVSLSEGKPV